MDDGHSGTVRKIKPGKTTFMFNRYQTKWPTQLAILF